MQIGTNLDFPDNYSPAFAFSDAMRMAKPQWGSAAVPYDGKAVLDANGLPIGDFGCVVMTSVPSDAGIYKLSFLGKADVSTPGTSAKIQNYIYDSVHNISAADVVLQAGSQLFLAFKNTSKLNANSLSLLRPNAIAGKMFDPRFVSDVKNYRTIRFMDWLGTNNSPIKTWADRSLPTNVLQATPKGVAIENCIELCNETGCDGWFNIPAMADDSYVLGMANLIKANLDPLLNIYLEYSNETWNGIFTQHVAIENQAKLDVAAGQTDLSLGGTDTNTIYWGWRKTAKRLSQISDIFISVFGAASLGKKVRPILSSQHGNVAVGRAQLAYLQKYNLLSKIFGHATAPYFATKSDMEPAATVDSINAGLASSVHSNVAAWVPVPWDGKTYSGTYPTPPSLSKYYGIPHLFYECGQSQPSVGSNAAAQALDLQVQSSAGLGKNYTDYFNGMPPAGIFLGCHFVNDGAWNEQHGCWGLINDYNISTPKYEAVMAACKTMNGPSMDELKAQILQLQSQVLALTTQVSNLQSIAKDLQTKINSSKISAQALLTSLS